MKKLLVFLLAFMLVLSLVGCGEEPTVDDSPDVTDDVVETDTPDQASGESIVINFGDAAATDSASGRAIVEFEKLVEERSEGRIQVELFLDGLLGSELEVFGQLQIGDIQIMATGVGSETSFLPQYGILSLPYLFEDAAQKERAIMDETVYSMLDASMIEAKDAHIIDVWMQGTRHLTANREILTPEDIVGVKLRVPENSTFVLAWKNLGANVMTIGMGDLYTALEQNTCDAQENPLDVIISQSLYEAQDYVMLTNHVPNMRYICVNNTWWNTLSEEDQTLIYDAIVECGLMNDEEIQSSEADQVKFLEDAGLTVLEVDTAKWVEAMNLEELIASVSEEMGWSIEFNEAVMAVE